MHRDGDTGRLEAGGPSGYEADEPPALPVQATYRPLLAAATTALREKGQVVSAADLIAVETMARGLAALRAHQEVWRRDLVDAIVGALVKDELEHGAVHPFLDAVYEVLRGREHGLLAAGTTLPPLVHDIQRELRDHDLAPAPRERAVELDLHAADGLAASRVLHRLQTLGIHGFERVAGPDLAARDDVSRLWERWRVRWSPDFDSSCIEAAIYGPSLRDAAGTRLKERADRLGRDAEAAALALLDACLMGADSLVAGFHARLVALVRADANFVTVARALGHLLYLYRYDDALGAAGRPDIGALLADDLLLAWVWSNYRGAISHESALSLYELSDVMPSRVQLTAPPNFRRGSPSFDVYLSSLTEADTMMYEGVRVTTPARSIVDAASAGAGPEQIRRAIAQAIQRGLVSPAQLRAAAHRPRYRYRRSVQPLIEGALDHASA